MALRPTLEQERIVLVFDHGAITADATAKQAKLHPQMSFRVDFVYYINPTGLATHASNFFNIKLKNGSTVVANWSTETGQQGTIAADTFVTLVNSVTDADLVLAAGGTLSLEFDETGDTTLPAGRFVIHGRYV